MKMHGVFVKAVKRRQVHATTKPANRLTVLAQRRGRQHAHIHVDRGHIGIAGVKHQRHAHRLERSPCQLRPMLGSGRRQPGAPHMRKTAAGALKHAALLQDIGNAIALQRLARLFLPGVGHKRLPIHFGNRAGDALLQPEQKSADD